jgi:CheY-like chemotaxis protein
MPDLSDWQVLLVDDEADAQAVVIPLLAHHGMAIRTAFTAEEALDILQSVHPTVAIIDLALPAMNGWELLESIRNNPALSDIPAVAVTAYYSTKVAQEAVAAGFAAFFPKPINARTFVEDLVIAVGES